MERNNVYLGETLIGEIISYWADESEPEIAKIFFINNKFTVTDFTINTGTWMFWRNIQAVAELNQIIAESKLFYDFFETHEFPKQFSYTRHIIKPTKNKNRWTVVFDKTYEVKDIKEFEKKMEVIREKEE